MARFLFSLLSATLLLFSVAHAQFQFFEQMFNGQQQQHHRQEPQNVPSDSAWYQENYEHGWTLFKHLFLLDNILICDQHTVTTTYVQTL